MKVWSKGLGKQALSVDWFKTDVMREGGGIVVKGIVRNGGVIWDCKFTFTKQDLPGLLYFMLSFPMLRHIARNIGGIFTCIYDKFIARQAGLKRSGGSL
jgi:hypothetical protein